MHLLSVHSVKGLEIRHVNIFSMISFDVLNTGENFYFITFRLLRRKLSTLHLWQKRRSTAKDV